MNTCNRSRLLFLPARSRRPSNLHILYRADCPPYCVQPTAELLHIEHKLALLHDNENTNGVDEHVRLATSRKFVFFPLFSKDSITFPKILPVHANFFKVSKNRGKRRKSSFGVTINIGNSIGVKMAIGIVGNLRTRNTYKYLSVEIKLIFYRGISLGARLKSAWIIRRAFRFRRYDDAWLGA